MSNILYRMQILPQEENEKRIIDSNELMDECIRQRRQEEQEHRRQMMAEEQEGTDGIAGDGVPAEEGFESLGQMAPEVSLPPEPEVDYVAEAQEEAERILEDARRQADELLATAQEQADALRSHAEAEGQKAGFDQGLQEAVAKQKELEQEVDAQRALLQQEYEHRQERMEHELVDVICAVVEQVFLIQFGDKKEIILHSIDNVLSGVEGSKEFLIRVNEQNCEFLRSHKEELQEKVGQETVLDIVQDPLLDDSQCMIETDGGLFDCSMDVQMRNLIKDIKSLS